MSGFPRAEQDPNMPAELEPYDEIERSRAEGLSQEASETFSQAFEDEIEEATEIARKHLQERRACHSVLEGAYMQALKSQSPYKGSFSLFKNEALYSKMKKDTRSFRGPYIR